MKDPYKARHLQDELMHLGKEQTRELLKAELYNLPLPDLLATAWLYGALGVLVAQIKARSS